VVLDHLVLDLALTSQNSAIKKRAQTKKAKINTKVAEVATDKVEKKSKSNKRPKVKTKLD
jgi:hypothetical protein